MSFAAKNDGIYLNNERLNLRGLSWFGCETPDYTFHGLWAVPWKSLVDAMVSEGYNLLRVPLSVQNMEDMDTLQPKTINYSVNPDLVGKSAGQVLDMVIAECTKRGMLILPDVHRNRATDGISELWYDDASGFPETRVINAWIKLLKRYRGNPLVFAADLRNEPHGRATWGPPAETDWASGAERMGNAILREFPGILIFVEGIERRDPPNAIGSYWGENLEGVRKRPIRLNVPERVVYSPHTYGPSVFLQPYYQTPEFPKNLGRILDEKFGFIAKEKLGAVLIGELGGKNEGLDAVWHQALAEYIERTPGLSHGSFAAWCLNVNGGDTASAILNDDWKTINKPKAAVYARMCPKPTKVLDLLKKGPAAPPTPPATPPLSPPGTPSARQKRADQLAGQLRTIAEAVRKLGSE